jgi:A/G-specific adenine glycosylase
MWTLPMIEGHLTKEACMKWLETAGFMVSQISALPATKHVFTHIEWQMIGYEVEIHTVSNDSSFTWVNREEIDIHYAIPTAHSFYLKYLR